MNSFGPESSEAEQKTREQKETQTASRIETPSPLLETNAGEKLFSPGLELGSGAEPEGFSPFPRDLTYSCLLIPRFNDHYLAGDITEYLTEWMKQICISYGWRLDAIVVRPGYLQWIMTVPPTSNPAQLMRLTRRHTSQKIFDEFPRFKLKNMSGDFWAPGYYVAPGNQLIPLEAISSFTLATRRQQGIY